MENRDSKLEATLIYIEEEIEIKIESMKIELDKLLEEFKKEVKGCKEDFVR